MKQKICTFVRDVSFYDALNNVLKERNTSQRLNRGNPKAYKILQIETNEAETHFALTSYDRIYFNADECQNISFVGNDIFLSTLQTFVNTKIMIH